MSAVENQRDRSDEELTALPENGRRCNSFSRSQPSYYCPAKFSQAEQIFRCSAAAHRLASSLSPVCRPGTGRHFPTFSPAARQGETGLLWLRLRWLRCAAQLWGLLEGAFDHLLEFGLRSFGQWLR